MGGDERFMDDVYHNWDGVWGKKGQKNLPKSLLKSNFRTICVLSLLSKTNGIKHLEELSNLSCMH